jgi:hypothetical protein
VFVPERFAQRVRLHVALNLLEPSGVTVPLILGVHGRPGEGKTTMTRHVLAEMGVLAIPMFADNFESVEAGEPPKELRRRYLKAAQINADIARGEIDHRLAVLVVDDLDQRIAGNPEVDLQQTQNTPLLNAAFMELADSPTCVDGATVARTPVIVTANHLDWLYEPVTRTGRMACFHWEPRLKERAETVRSIFPELSEADISRLLKEHPDRRLSDFGAARYAICEADLAIALSTVEPARIIETIRRAGRSIDWKSTQISIDAVLEAMTRLPSERTHP